MAVASVCPVVPWGKDWLLVETSSDTVYRYRPADGSLHPKKAKEELAHEFVCRFHGQKAADEAQADFNAVFANGGVPQDAPEGTCESGEKSDPVSILADFGLAKSRSEARRKIAEGGFYIDGTQCKDDKTPLAPGSYVIRFGKKKFLKLTVR